jgi:hypothetical protein
MPWTAYSLFPGLQGRDVARFEYDEPASEAEHMDVVHEVPDDKPVPVARWVESMRRLNSIGDSLARRLLKLHRVCGYGSGECDSAGDDPVAIADRSGWGCETKALIADRFGVEHPKSSRHG